eukprot:245764-Prymnesium_polylepis.1
MSVRWLCAPCALLRAGLAMCRCTGDAAMRTAASRSPSASAHASARFPAPTRAPRTTQSDTRGRCSRTGRSLPGRLDGGAT